MNKKIKKLAVLIPYRGIGDIIFHLPLLKTLYKNYNNKITIVTDKANKARDVFKREKFIKRIIYCNFNRGAILEKFCIFIELKRIIDALKVDILILTNPSKRLVLPVFFSNAKNKIYLGVKWNYFFFTKQKNWYKKNLAIHLKNLIYYLKLKNPDFSYKLDNSWKIICKNKNLKKKSIFISLDSHFNHNNWDINNFIKIIDSIKNKSIFINTSPSHFDIFRKYLIKYKNKKNIKITSNFSLNKLIQTISCCEIIIGNESGPVCIGAALNKKVLSIYNDKTSKPESKIISKKIKYFNTSKLNTTKIINAINKYIIKNS
jgi:ADP-heptose:LPS heptosyltransferase